MGYKKYTVGEKYHSLLITNENSGLTPSGDRLVECKCICGNSTVTRASYLGNGHTKSCGCLIGTKTLKHDDGYTRGPLALAAAAYALMSVEDIPEQIELSDDGLPTFWPWDEKWFKPTTPRRNLVKAAALILAEIERIDRAEASNDN